MDDTDDYRARSGRNSIFESGRSAFQSQQSFQRSTSVTDDHDALVRAAMEEAEKHPERHRMAVLPSKSKKNLALVDVTKLTTSKKRLVLSRAMESSGQDNERLLTKIRERQDRYCLSRRRKTNTCRLTIVIYLACSHGARPRPAHIYTIMWHNKSIKPALTECLQGLIVALYVIPVFA